MQGQMNSSSLSLPAVVGQAVLIVSVREISRESSLYSSICLLPVQTLICSNLLARCPATKLGTLPAIRLNHDLNSKWAETEEVPLVG